MDGRAELARVFDRDVLDGIDPSTIAVAERYPIFIGARQGENHLGSFQGPLFQVVEIAAPKFYVGTHWVFPRQEIPASDFSRPPVPFHILEFSGPHAVVERDRLGNASSVS